MNEQTIRSDSQDQIWTPPSPRPMIESLASQARDIIRRACHLKLGICASASGIFSDQVWIRDLAFAFLALPEFYPEVLRALKTILKHQKPSGELPMRAERVRHWLSCLGCRRIARRFGTHFVYPSDTLAMPALDTIPAAIIVFAALYRHSPNSREDLQKLWPRLRSAMMHLKGHIRNGFLIGGNGQDWADSLRRRGALSNTNILLLIAYYLLEMLAFEFGDFDFRQSWELDAWCLDGNIFQRFWDEKKGFFKVGLNDERFEAISNILYALFFPTKHISRRIVETLEGQLEGDFHLVRTFDSPYPKKQIDWRTHYFGIDGYGNHNIYPWMTGLALIARLRVDKGNHHNSQRQQAVVDDFVRLSRYYFANEGFYEVYDCDTHKPSCGRSFGRVAHRSCPDFTASAATYLAAYHAIKNVGLLPT